jgi:hypothetical protein
MTDESTPIYAGITMPVTGQPSASTPAPLNADDEFERRVQAEVAKRAAGNSDAPASAAGTAVEPPAPVNADTDFDTRVKAVLAASLADMEKKHAGEMAALRAETNQQIAAARASALGPGHLVPEHAGGPGTNIVSSWGQWLQDLSTKGELTTAHLIAAGIHTMNLHEA